MLSRANRFRVRGPAVLSILAIAAIAAACGAASAPAGPAGPGVGGPAQGGAAAPGATSGGALSGGQTGGDAGGGGGNDNQGGGDPGVVDQAGLLIVKNGALAIQVAGLDAAVDAASRLIRDLGGYASASQRFGEDDDAQATVTYRIPVTRWDDALTGLRGLGEKVIDERYSTEEVTAQVVDLEARITNLRTSEAALQAIMDRAVDIEDVLTVQAKLTETRSQIEQLTAQKTNLEGRAAFSTLAVTYALKKDPILAEQQGFDPANEVERASANLVGMLQAVATAGIWFGIVWIPVLLFLGILGGVIYLVARRFLRQGPGQAGPPAPAPEAGAP
jgi:hypothetical protein